MSDPSASRLSKLRSTFAADGIDALLVTHPDSRRYLTGFTGSAGWVLVTPSHTLIATDFRYFEQVGLEAPEFELVPVTDEFTDVLPRMLAITGSRRLGFEADYATYAEVQAWKASVAQCEWIGLQGRIMGLRAEKDELEIAAIRKAVALADEALAVALTRVHAGMTELELAWEIESYLRTHGAQGVSFETIVSCGPNGARPHARAGETKLVAGEPIVIDMGARVDGYCSDLTRTICLGEPNDPEHFWFIYESVLQAQQAAEAAIHPGRTGQEIDGVARSLIADRGYGDSFGHGLGHGVGIAIHESPRLNRTATGPLKPGNVVTVEPGIYLPGWGGIRIEDLVLVSQDGCEVLTKAPKQPIVSTP